MTIFEAPMSQTFPPALLHQPPADRLAWFRQKVIRHPHLDTAFQAVQDAIRAPAGATLILVIGATGFAEAIERLDTIPGVARQTAILMVAEMGVAMAQFPSDKHLAAWAGLAPGNNQTGGKQRPARTRKGNRYLRRGLVQAAHAAARKRGSYLKALYHRIAARRGAKRAIVAVARTILQIAYHLLERGTTYEELGEDYFDQREVHRTKRRLVNRLEALGFTVRVEEPVTT
jgi:hypothetical protein